ncbi:hypothetical protein J5N97_001637 [Dioscorea zingiberensis]|uniref:Uncharacterized protein n=1 Tax=Dioscorea zingiberensis TaxID=325984 RepID=A0A9D5BTG3_9LILI|nr:hypothetical protein J5N97_001637 [Dioscorea zingiberensis]
MESDRPSRQLLQSGWRLHHDSSERQCKRENSLQLLLPSPEIEAWRCSRDFGGVLVFSSNSGHAEQSDDDRRQKDGEMSLRLGGGLQRRKADLASASMGAVVAAGRNNDRICLQGVGRTQRHRPEGDLEAYLYFAAKHDLRRS